MALALGICPLIGGCPPSQVRPGALESQLTLDPLAYDLAILENAMTPEEHTALAIARGESVVHVVENGEDFYLYETDIAPEEAERLLAAVITPPTTDIFVKTKSGLCWMEGQANGPFILRPFIFAGPIAPFNADNFVAVDFSNDGAIDAVVAHLNPALPADSLRLQLLRNNGAGAFMPGQVIPLPGMAHVKSLTTGDVNGDTHPDLLAVSGEATRVLVGQPDGTFLHLDTSTGATSATATPPLPGASTGRLTRFNADASADIVLSPNTGGVAVRLGNGNGTFQTPFTLPGISTSNMVIDDFDADGFRDVVLAGGSPGVVAIYHGTPAGGVTAPLLLDGANSADRVGVFYAPGDTRPDLFTVHKFDDVIQTYLNTDEGWQVGDRVPLIDQFGQGLAPRDGALLDLNGDDYLDIASGGSDRLLSFTLNAADGTGAFLPTRAEDQLATIIQVHPLKPLAGQGDTRQPLVAILSPFRFATIGLLNTSVVPNVWSFTQSFSFPTNPTDVTSADFNADGREDLVFTHAAAPGSISLYLQDAAGVFGPRQGIGAPGGAWNVVSASDLDGVNGSDLIVADAVAGTALALMNNGAGGFVSGAGFSAPGPLSLNIVATDINGDGKPDLVVGSDFAVRAYPVGAGGAIGSPSVIPLARRPARVAVHDINGDGRPDIVAATKPDYIGGDGVVGVALNSATGITTNPPTYHYTNGDPAWLGVGDLRHPSKGAPDGAAKPTPTVIVLGNSLSQTYENMTLLDTVAFALPCPGDANGDNVVDFLDLNIVLSDFGQSGAPGALQGDLDDDGDCDFVDLNIVLSAFGAAC